MFLRMKNSLMIDLGTAAHYWMQLIYLFTSAIHIYVVQISSCNSLIKLRPGFAICSTWPNEQYGLQQFFPGGKFNMRLFISASLPKTNFTRRRRTIKIALLDSIVLIDLYYCQTALNLRLWKSISSEAFLHYSFYCHWALKHKPNTEKPLLAGFMLAVISDLALER